MRSWRVLVDRAKEDGLHQRCTSTVYTSFSIPKGHGKREEARSILGCGRFHPTPGIEREGQLPSIKQRNDLK